LRIVAPHDRSIAGHECHGFNPSTVLESLDSISIRSYRDCSSIAWVFELTTDALDVSEKVGLAFDPNALSGHSVQPGLRTGGPNAYVAAAWRDDHLVGTVALAEVKALARGPVDVDSSIACVADIAAQGKIITARHRAEAYPRRGRSASRTAN